MEHVWILPKESHCRAHTAVNAGWKVHGALLECLAAGAHCQLQCLSHLHVASQPPGGRSRFLCGSLWAGFPGSKSRCCGPHKAQLRSQARHFCCIPLVKISYKANPDSSGIEINFTSSWENWQTRI